MKDAHRYANAMMAADSEEDIPAIVEMYRDTILSVSENLKLELQGREFDGNVVAMKDRSIVLIFPPLEPWALDMDNYKEFSEFMGVLTHICDLPEPMASAVQAFNDNPAMKKTKVVLEMPS